MNENEVIEAVCAHFTASRHIVTSRCLTTERGIDIVAKQDGREIFIEAKGGTSAREGSSRYGKASTESQIFDRVAKGFYTAACLRHAKGPEPIVGLAFPDSRFFRKYASKLGSSAKALRISFYWVGDNKDVKEEHPDG